MNEESSDKKTQKKKHENLTKFKLFNIRDMYGLKRDICNSCDKNLACKQHPYQRHEDFVKSPQIDSDTSLKSYARLGKLRIHHVEKSRQVLNAYMTMEPTLNKLKK